MTTEDLRNKIKACDMERPFIFVSYKRDDADKVFPFVLELQNKGINLWIDKEMKSAVGDSWQDPAFDAIFEMECSAILFFASKKALVSAPILAELTYAGTETVSERHEDNFKILSVDIDGLVESDGSIKGYVKKNKKQLKDKCDKGKITSMFPLDKFCDWKKDDISALSNQLLTNYELANKILKAANIFDEKITLAKSADEIAATYEKMLKELEDKEKRDNLDKTEETEELEDTEKIENTEDLDNQEDTEEGEPEPTEESGYKYQLFGQEFSAQNQNKLMYDTFEMISKKHPQALKDVVKTQCVAYAEEVKKPNTTEAYPTYFRSCKEFTVEGKKYLVGSSYGFPAKLAQIRKMLAFAGVSVQEFILLQPKLSKAERGKKGRNNDFIDIRNYTKDSLPSDTESYAKVFDKYVGEKNAAVAYAVTMGLIMEKHPTLITINDNLITDDFDVANKYRSMKQILCNGKTYYVNTHSSTDAKKQNINAVVKKLKLDSEEVVFNYSSDKGDRNNSTGKISGKQGVYELLK